MKVSITLDNGKIYDIAVTDATVFSLRAFVADQNNAEPGKYADEGAALVAIIKGAVAPLIVRYPDALVAIHSDAVSKAESDFHAVLAAAASPSVQVR